MEEVLKKKPIAQLKAADSSVKAYVQLLEKKLASCITMNNLNKDIERKLFRTINELNALKIQLEETQRNDVQYQENLHKINVKNQLLDIENQELKQHNIFLRNEVQHLKFAMFSRTAEVASNTHKLPQICRDNITDNDPNANSVLIKGFAEHPLNIVLKNRIIDLAQSMNLKLLVNDVVKVTKLERKYYKSHNLIPSKLILIVQLKTPELKVEFLKNKGKLKENPDHQEIEISDYVSDEVYNLYQYAKILKSCDYAHIYWRNNCVYAKKTRSTYCDPVPIKTKADVDVLKNCKK